MFYCSNGDDKAKETFVKRFGSIGPTSGGRG